MSYFSLFHLKEEPFSNSPDPELYYQGPRHADCLHKLEIAIRLKRGLNVVLGDVGAGKTTMCRHLLRTLQSDDRVEAHLLLDPYFETPREFLAVVCRMLQPTGFEFDDTEWRLKERIKNALFRFGVDENKVVALIIDEGQKITVECLEALRELLNYETNNSKLLQIIIFAQTELKAVIDAKENFADRINELIEVKPLSRRETAKMIRHRLEAAKDTFKAPDLFTPAAIAAIHKATGGYPRKIMRLCHKALLLLARKREAKVTSAMVAECLKGDRRTRPNGRAWAYAALLLIALVLTGAVLYAMWRPQGSHDASAQAESRVVEDSVANEVEPPVHEALLTLEEDTDGDILSPPALSGHSVEPAVDVAVQDAQADEQDELGEWVVETEGTLEDLSRRIYGPLSSRALEGLLAANPQYEVGETLARGTRLVLPAFNESSFVPQHDEYMVHVATYPELVSAMQVAGTLVDSGWDAACMPVNREGEGTRFALVLMESFPDESSAHAAFAELPAENRGRARIIRGWDTGATVLAHAQDPVHLIPVR
ncbi:MAG: hypothetical protein D6E12_04160 [Desulfovibrio sp.]|nr:MAG: hypothetical protein D6E12_04160 [Desulfovibrio sp.]